MVAAAWTSMKANQERLLATICLMSFVMLLGLFNMTKPRILVIHSGNKDSEWVSTMDRGMKNFLDKNRRPITIEWLYLKLSNQTTEARARQAQAEARRAILRMQPELIIAVDDEANQLIARHYINKKNIKIIYVSLTRSPESYGYLQATNVSGISEKLPFTGIKKAILDLPMKRWPRIWAVGSNTVTGRAEIEQFKSMNWSPLNVANVRLVSTTREWKDFSSRIPESDILIALNSKGLANSEENISSDNHTDQWTQKDAKNLVIGTQIEFVKDGGALSFSPPADDYGEQAISMALDWLDQRQTPGPPKPVESNHFSVSARPSALERKGIELPQIYIEAARASKQLFH